MTDIVLDQDGTAHAVDADDPETLCGRYVPDDWRKPQGLRFYPGKEPHYGPMCSQCAQLYTRRERVREL